MSIDLVLSNPISANLQPIAGQGGGSSSGLSIATNATVIAGQDIVGGALPLVIQAQAVNGQSTLNRILRLMSSTGSFFDIGIDASGNLFINSNQTNGILTLSPAGQLTVPNLVLSNLQTAPEGSVDLAAGPNGAVYTQ